jgi:hypothetical protein
LSFMVYLKLLPTKEVRTEQTVGTKLTTTQLQCSTQIPSGELTSDGYIGKHECRGGYLVDISTHRARILNRGPHIGAPCAVHILGIRMINGGRSLRLAEPLEEFDKHFRRILRTMF